MKVALKIQPAPSRRQLFFFIPILTQFLTKRCCTARFPTPHPSHRRPPASPLFFSRLLSLGPNYVVDRVIDTGETESPQQAARGPS